MLLRIFLLSCSESLSDCSCLMHEFIFPPLTFCSVPFSALLSVLWNANSTSQSLHEVCYVLVGTLELVAVLL